jgi:hypothetical protein
MKAEGRLMKLLRVDDSCGHYLDDKGGYRSIDKIAKDDLLRLVNWTLHEEVVEFDDYDENLIKNQAHQIIYRSILEKLRSLRERRREFIDSTARLFLEDYERYRDSARE